tara:strand:- start:285 stop:617 length:333 start_codon:yes stop_codon:yes gene_type:complete
LYKENIVLLIRDRLCKSDFLQQDILSKNLERYNNRSSDNEFIVNDVKYYLSDLPIMISCYDVHMFKIIALVIGECVEEANERGGDFYDPNIYNNTKNTQENIILVKIIEG